MEEDNIITLKDGKKYLLLLESEYTHKDYFLAILLDEKEELTDQYEVLETKEVDGKTLARRVKDPFLLQELISDFEEQNKAA